MWLIAFDVLEYILVFEEEVFEEEFEVRNQHGKGLYPEIIVLFSEKQNFGSIIQSVKFLS